MARHSRLRACGSSTHGTGLDDVDLTTWPSITRSCRGDKVPYLAVALIPMPGGQLLKFVDIANGVRSRANRAQ